MQYARLIDMAAAHYLANQDQVGRTGSTMTGTARRTGMAMVVLAVAPLLAQCAPAASAQDRRPPYWASISRNEAIMRRGPSTEMPARWAYRRLGLPLRVLAVREDWRRVADPDGETGWMHRRLLSAQRSAIVTGSVQPMYVGPDSSSPVAFRAEEGVVGRLGECRDGFCEFDVRGRIGWIAADGIWGDGSAATP